MVNALFVSCHLLNDQESISQLKCNCKWGLYTFPDQLDSDRLISPGIDFSMTCFPSDFLKDKDIIPLKISVLNRSGAILYQSNNFTTDWICNDNNIEYNSGTYYFLLSYKTEESETIKDYADTVILKCID